MTNKQTTIKRQGRISGHGLHTKKKINLKLLPAKENQGIIFRRMDLEKKIEIPAILANVSHFRMSTNLSKEKVHVKTVEHLLSAINYLNIDNILIDIDSEEIPITDGSAYPFIFLLKFCGIKVLKAEKKIMKIKKKFIVNLKESFILVIPNNELIIKAHNNKILKINELMNFNFNEKKYEKKLSKSRTFGFYEKYEYLKSNNLSNGVNFKNTLIFKNKNLINYNMMRYKNEITRHKILDLIGDMTLIKYKIIGFFLCFNINHEINNKLINTILSNNSLYEIIK